MYFLLLFIGNKKTLLDNNKYIFANEILFAYCVVTKALWSVNINFQVKTKCLTQTIGK